MNGPLPVCISPEELLGSKDSQTFSGARKFRAQGLGIEYGAPTANDVEENSGFYSKEHGNGAPELHREDALLSAWRDEEDLKLREQIRTKERAPATPTPPNGSR